ncbi:MAG: N-acetyl-gamma-glutamyl-phosphate reductase [Pacificimonas sp.]
MTDRIRIAVLGASGYTGADLVRLALTHPNVEIVALGANAKAGQWMADIWPHLRMYPELPRLTTVSEIDFGETDVVFGCLPHATSAKLLSSLEGPRIIDLSADFRLDDPDIYAEWYGGPHEAPALMTEAVYGLTEFAEHALRKAKLVACPGCYPTAALLALLPLVEGDLIDPERIGIMAMSGVTGAGRAAKEGMLHAEVSEAVHPYGLAGHRHMPEIEQEIGKRVGREVRVGFVPHLLPMNRGELETITVEMTDGQTVESLRNALADRYTNAPFVHLLPDGVAPATRMVRGSNHAVMNVFADRIPGRALVIVAIDNLVKGSAGQAIQNMNLMFGLPGTAGLTQAPLFP